jgi:hypothetical protein
MHRSHFISAVAVCAVCFAAVPWGAVRAATQVLAYNVEHPTYGTIGTYTNTVSENGNSAEVRTDLHVSVKMIGIPLFHQDATRDEHWENRRLVSFQSATDDNGTDIKVSGKAAGSKFVINSSTNGTLTAPAQVHPSNPWAPFVLQTDTMMSSKTGKISPVVVRDTGEITTTFDGRPMRVHQWFVDDEKHQVVWIDERGIVVAFQTSEQGTPVNFVLKNESASTEPSASVANR